VCLPTLLRGSSTKRLVLKAAPRPVSSIRTVKNLYAVVIVCAVCAIVVLILHTSRLTLGLRGGRQLKSHSRSPAVEQFSWERRRKQDESATGRVLESGVANHMFVPEGQLRGLRIRKASSSSSSSDEEDAGFVDWIDEDDVENNVAAEIPEAEKKREELDAFSTMHSNTSWEKLRMLKVVFDKGEWVMSAGLSRDKRC